MLLVWDHTDCLCLSTYWLDCHEILCRLSWFPEDQACWLRWSLDISSSTTMKLWFVILDNCWMNHDIWSTHLRINCNNFSDFMTIHLVPQNVIPILMVLWHNMQLPVLQLPPGNIVLYFESIATGPNRWTYPSTFYDHATNQSFRYLQNEWYSHQPQWHFVFSAHLQRLWAFSSEPGWHNDGINGAHVYYAVCCEICVFLHILQNNFHVNVQ